MNKNTCTKLKLIGGSIVFTKLINSNFTICILKISFHSWQNYVIYCKAQTYLWTILSFKISNSNCPKDNLNDMLIFQISFNAWFQKKFARTFVLAGSNKLTNELLCSLPQPDSLHHWVQQNEYHLMAYLRQILYLVGEFSSLNKTKWK